MKVHIVADIEVHMVADMEVDNVADKIEEKRVLCVVKCKCKLPVSEDA